MWAHRVARLFSSCSRSRSRSLSLTLGVCDVKTYTRAYGIKDENYTYTASRALALATCWSKFSSILIRIRFMCIDMPPHNCIVSGNVYGACRCLRLTLTQSHFSNQNRKSQARSLSMNNKYTIRVGLPARANCHGSLVHMLPLKILLFTHIRFDLHTQSKQAPYKKTNREEKNQQQQQHHNI